MPIQPRTPRQTASQHHQPLSTDDAAQGLLLLAEAHDERESALEEYAPEPEQQDTDEENDSECPIFDSFYESGGSAGITKMINFDPKEFDTVWNLFGDFIERHYNTGRGKSVLLTSPRMSCS